MTFSTELENTVICIHLKLIHFYFNTQVYETYIFPCKTDSVKVSVCEAKFYAYIYKQK